MDTELIAVDVDAPDMAVIQRAADLIRGGALVAFPTETVYGLGANALDADAVQRIFDAKGRPFHDPLIVHVSGSDQLPLIAAEISPIAQKLAAEFWPGPLTLVLPRTAAIPNVVTAGGATVAVRAPDHPLAQALLRAADLPIAAPSANRFGHTSPTTARHVWDDLAGAIEMILDGGPTTIGLESTVLDLTTTPPTILRHGGITVETLRQIIGDVDEGITGNADQAAQQILPSPGMLERHYAPRTPLVLYHGEAARDLMVAIAERLRQDGIRPVVLAFDEDLNILLAKQIPVERLGSESDLAQVARQLYGALRAADASGATILLAREPRGGGIGAALRDRLRRAAETIVDANNP